LTQGSNTSSVQINFPTPPSPSISITSASPSVVSVSPPSGNAFTISATPPSFTSSDGITNITGTYPNYIVTTTPTLSISGNNLSISGGNTVTLPTAPTPTIIGQGIANIIPVSGYSFTIDVPSPTLNIIQSTPGQATFSLSQGTSSTSHTLTFPPSSVTLYGSGIANVSPNGSPSSTFTVNVPSPTLSANSSTSGVTTITINQGSAINITTFDILPAIQNNAWGVNGNTVTSSNYLGTNNSADLIFKTNNTERMRISSNGEVGIGTTNPTAQLHIVTPSSNTANIALQIDNGHIKASPSSSISFTFTYSGGATPTGSFVTGNDVRGQCGLTLPAGTPLHIGDYYKFTIPFSKSYSNTPYIILTPASSLYGLTLRVGNVTTTNFEIILEYQPGNTFPPTAIPAATTFLINYFVIE
jgi:hypothetical protein